MYPPKEYGNIINTITDSILSFNPEDLIAVLTFECSIGPIISPTDCDDLKLLDAFSEVRETQDVSLFEQIHLVLSNYISPVIELFYNITKNKDNYEYLYNDNYDDTYLWAEKYYYKMFGIWTPRILVLYYNKQIHGSKIISHQHEGKKYTFCPMENNEVGLKRCLDCPFVHQMQEKSPNLTNSSSGLLYCKYKELLNEEDEY